MQLNSTQFLICKIEECRRRWGELQIFNIANGKDSIYCIYTNTLNESNDIALSFTGDNSFKGLIGTRMKISFLDCYIDYNIGVSNVINAGFGITF